MIMLAKLWRGKSKAGNDYLSGYWGEGRLLIFPNKQKKTDRDPSHFLFVAEKQAAPVDLDQVLPDTLPGRQAPAQAQSKNPEPVKAEVSYDDPPF